MKHLRNFSSLSEYEIFVNQNVVPNVCFIENIHDVIYNEANTPFYIEALEDLTVSIDIKNNRSIEYSINGSDYATLESNTQSPIVKAGQRIYLITTATSKGSSSIGKFSISGKCNVGGNLLSLHTANYTLSSTSLCYYCYDLFSGTPIISAAALKMPKLLDRYSCTRMFKDCTLLKIPPLVLPATTLTSGCYGGMFAGCTSLIIAPKLPATQLADYCYCNYSSSGTGSYLGMFEGCTSLIEAPELPATTLKENCYANMFKGCTSLKKAPALPATTLAGRCYYNMFYDCTSLTAAPALPATTLASGCYYNMFRGCTSLTAAPELPATTLTNSCYSNMFYGCKSLTAAPELPATTLAEYCYYYMFQSCSSLNYIKMLATNISATSCLAYWVSGVSPTGTFVKNAAATWDVTGVSGIPNGWTVETVTVETAEA